MREGKRKSVLVTGGCRSGKSAYALRLVQGRSRRIFIATAEAGDEEMRKRIERHKRERGRGWVTIEEPINVVDAIANVRDGSEIVIIDCVTLWLSNLMIGKKSDESIMERVNALANEIKRMRTDMVMVTNEVGWGIVPDNAQSRKFRDLAGAANSILAGACDRVVLMVSGVPLTIKEDDNATPE